MTTHAGTTYSRSIELEAGGVMVIHHFEAADPPSYRKLFKAVLVLLWLKLKKAIKL